MSKPFKGITVLTFAFIAVLFSGMVAAQGFDGATTTSNSGNQTIDTSEAQNETIQAGAVVDLDISQSSLTEKWAGFYGEISASRVLGNSGGTLFEWTASNFADANVLAVPQGDTQPTDASDLGDGYSDPNSLLGAEFNSGVANASGTFNLTDSVDLLGTSFSTSAVNTYNSSGSASDRFTTYLLENTAEGGAPVYVAEGSNSGPGFDGTDVNYQLLVGVGDSAADETYTFYLELP